MRSEACASKVPDRCEHDRCSHHVEIVPDPSGKGGATMEIHKFDVVVALHFNCVACREQAEPETLGGVVVLALVRAGHPAGDIYDDLCFAHRRQVDDATKAVRARMRR